MQITQNQNVLLYFGTEFSRSNTLFIKPSVILLVLINPSFCQVRYSENTFYLVSVNFYFYLYSK